MKKSQNSYYLINNSLDDLFFFGEDETKKDNIQQKNEKNQNFFYIENRRTVYLHRIAEDDFIYTNNFAKKLRENFFEYINEISNKETKIGDIEWIVEIPSKKLAFFFHDLLNFSEFHAGKKKNHNVLLLKHYLSKGYTMCSIYSDEWLFKDDQVKKRIHYKFFNYKKICNARETTIKEINKKDYNDFVAKEHLQGSQKANIRFGAYYDGNLVAVMSFDKRRLALGAKSYRYSNKDYEMIRFCTRGNIPGIGSKLLKYFIETYEPENIVSYSDRRWGEGKFYEKIGFSYAGESLPSYYYTNDYLLRRYRFTFRKDVLIKKYGVDPNLTEVQIAKSLGYDRIWDCGTNKYIMDFTNKLKENNTIKNTKNIKSFIDS